MTVRTNLSNDGIAIRKLAERVQELRDRTLAEVGRVVVGMEAVTHQFLIALLAAGLASWGSIPVLAVVALQTLLAATGFCLGCRLFFLRWWVPELFARLVGRGIRREALIMVEIRD